MDNAALLPIALLLVFSLLVAVIQFSRHKRQAVRIKMVDLLSHRGSMSKKEVLNALFWLERNRLFFSKEDFCSAKEILSEHADLIDRSCILHASPKEHQ